MKIKWLGLMVMNGLVLAERKQLEISEKAEDKLTKENLAFRPHTVET